MQNKGKKFSLHYFFYLPRQVHFASLKFNYYGTGHNQEMSIFLLLFPRPLHYHLCQCYVKLIKCYWITTWNFARGTCSTKLYILDEKSFIMCGVLEKGQGMTIFGLQRNILTSLKILIDFARRNNYCELFVRGNYDGRMRLLGMSCNLLMGCLIDFMSRLDINWFFLNFWYLKF